MFFAPPIYYDELMKKVPKGKLITVSVMRDYLAKTNITPLIETIIIRIPTIFKINDFFIFITSSHFHIVICLFCNKSINCINHPYKPRICPRIKYNTY